MLLKNSIWLVLLVYVVFLLLQLLLGSGVGTVRLYDTDAKKSLYEMTIDTVHPR